MPTADAELEEPTTAVEVPFWGKYNSHYEFPTSVVLSVLACATLFAGVVVVLLYALGGGRDMKPVPIVVIQGNDDSGLGRLGGGGFDSPLAEGDQIAKPQDKPIDLPDTRLPDVKDQPNAPKLPDLNKPGALPNSNATPFEELVKSLKEGRAGARKGGGPGDGRGNTGQPGDGPGGTGTDDTHKRSLRWSLRFKMDNARDYLAQIAVLGGVVVLPLPDNRDAQVYRDLKRPRGERMADGEWEKLAGQIQFYDQNPKWAKEVADALGAGFAPQRFMVFFPRELEDELSRKEIAYRNRKAEDIEETVFRVTVRGGNYEIVVETQTPKR